MTANTLTHVQKLAKQSQSFSWKKVKDKQQKQLLRRYKSLVRCNPEWAANHNNLARELNNDEIKNKIETIAAIKEHLEKCHRYGTIPKPKLINVRMNRNV